MTAGKHMAFTRYGSSYHLRVADTTDLEQVAHLNEAHWVANNAAITTINCDDVFLRLVDRDGNGRITCHEVADAIDWLSGILRVRHGVTERSRTLLLNAVDTETQQGQQIDRAAKKILARLNKNNAEQVTLEQVRQVRTQVESMPVSEAGVVLPEAADDPQVQQFIADVIKTVAGAQHPTGAQGIDTAHLEKFLGAVAAYVDWHEQGQIPRNSKKTGIMPLGTDTGAAYEAFASAKDKIDQYFAQCEVLAADGRFGQYIGHTEEELQQLNLDDPQVIQEVLKEAPLAKPVPTQVLDFEKSTNPYYADALGKFRQETALPVLGELPTELTKKQWHKIKSFFAEHEDWVKAKPSDGAEVLGLQKLKEYLDERFAGAARALISDSINTAIDLENIRATEKLILYQAYLMDLVNNFVSFPHLYDPNSRAMFEMGTLVMDGRRFNLAVKVGSRPQHIQLAKTSNMYVLYVQVTPKDESRKFEVAVPVTSGGKRNLCIGKRGVFYDISGKEFDALVVDIVENPISFREALSAPFRRLGRILTGKIESITSEAEKKLDERASQAVSQPEALPAPAGSPATAGRTTSTGGIVMGAGIAIAALGSAAAYIVKTLAAISLFRILAFILGAVALLMAATSIVAFLKLRRRDLSAILEGSGWGINARMRLTFRQGRYFTERPKYPKGARGIRRAYLRLAVTVLVLILLLVGGVYLLRHTGTRKTKLAAPEAVPTQSTVDK